MKSKSPYFLITCEHADYKIPQFIKSKLPYLGNLKKTHQAYDEYALEIANQLKTELKHFGYKSDVVFYPYTRLLIDANRTPGNKGFHSVLSKHLSPSELEKLENEYYSYVQKCENLIKQHLKSRNVYILSIHSFTPVYKNKKRKTQLGLLFRNSILKESVLSNQIKKEMKKLSPTLQVHKNRPYRGHTDCLSNYLLDKNKSHPNINGIFLEFNQSFIKTEVKSSTKNLAMAFQNIL